MAFDLHRRRSSATYVDRYIAVSRDTPATTRGFAAAQSSEVPRRTGDEHPTAARSPPTTVTTSATESQFRTARRHLSRLRFYTTRTRAATLLRANPYPEVTDRFCRLPLPTLFYAARGCSPRRPAADIGTNRREDSAWPSLGFSRSAWGSRTPPQRAVLFALAPLSPG